MGTCGLRNPRSDCVAHASAMWLLLNLLCTPVPAQPALREGPREPAVLQTAEGFQAARPPVPNAARRSRAPQLNFFQAISSAAERLLEEMDNFADDAVGRRLGQGAKFYGKRKSSFYGEDDAQRKQDPRVADREEDFSGPAGGSYFLLSEERDEQGRPLGFLTRKEAREAKARKAAEAEGMLADFAQRVESDASADPGFDATEALGDFAKLIESNDADADPVDD